MIKKYKLPFLLILPLLLLTFTSKEALAKKTSWDITFVLDQSGSMLETDRSQYALLIPSLIADLSSEEDRVTIIPQDNTLCVSVPCQNLVELNSQRASFKATLAMLPGSSSFTKPLKTALVRHQEHSSYDQSIVSLVYDDQNQNSNESAEIRNMIQKSGQDGYVFVMSNQTEFIDLFGMRNGNRVKDSKTLLKAYSQFFRKILRSKDVPFGTSSADKVSIKIAPDAIESTLVIISHEEIQDITALSGNPKANLVDIMPSDTGYTYPPRVPTQSSLSYQLVHIDHPTPGEWSFQVKTKSSQVSWLLLSQYELPIANVQVNGQPYIGGKVACSTEGCEIVAKLPPQNRLSGAIVDPYDPTHVTPFNCDAQGVCKAKYVPKSDNDQHLDIRFESKHAHNSKKLSLSVSHDLANHHKCGTTQFSFPVHWSSGLKYFLMHPNSHQVSQETMAQNKILLRRGGQEITPDELRLYRATEADVQESSALSVGDWIMQATFTKISSPQPLKEQIQFLHRKGSAEQSCNATLEFLPMVNLALTADKEKHDLEACGGLPSELGEACHDCGACQQSVFKLNYAGSSISHSVEGLLSLDTELPNQVSLIINETKVDHTHPLKVTLNPSGVQEFNALICVGFCPQGDGAPQELSFSLSTEHVFTPRSSEPSTSKDNTQVTLHIEPSIWWVCWLPTIILSLKVLVFLLFSFGFFTPLRFPKSLNNHLPYAVASTTSTWLLDIESMQKTFRKEMPTIRWYRNDYAYLSFPQDDLDILQSQGLLKVTLKSEGGYITCTQPDTLYELSYQVGVSARFYSLDSALDPHETHPINSSSIYYYKPEDRWILFYV